MFQTRKTLFGHIWLKKSKLSVKTEILYQETYLNMRNSMMMLTFSQFLTGNTFLSKFDPKNKDCQFELRFCSRLILICRIMQKLCGVHFFCFRPEKPFLGKYEEFNSEVHFFVFSTGSIRFFGNLFQKSKLFLEAEIQNIDSFEYVEFDGNFLFFQFGNTLFVLIQ